jgi:GntP family gluconate:H+ symporter
MHPFIILLIGMAVVIGGVLLLRLHAFLALLLGALVVAIITPPEAVQQFALTRGMSEAAARQLASSFFFDRVADGFGRTVGQIGIIIVMASIIGDCMLQSGAADRIVRSALRLLGEKRAPQAFLSSSYLLGIPVFFDTVFYLMIPLVKAMRFRTGRNYLWYVMAVFAGASMTHSLVPPTPGPLFVANELGVSLAMMIVMGCIVGGFTSVSGYFFARWSNARMDIPLRESEEAIRQLESLAQRDDRSLPPLWLSLLPIILPVALITASAVIETKGWRGRIFDLLSGFGDKNISLIIGAVIALAILLKYASSKKTEEAVKTAIASAGVIILITSAGGAFGAVLQQTGIGGAIQKLSTGYQTAILPMAFLLTALIRTAQGSATVAMITAAGAFSGFVQSAQLGFHPVYLAVVIGCGSKPFGWMNDSGFWVVTQMSGMTEKEGLKTITPLTGLMGFVGLIVIMILAKLVPLV